MRGVIAAVLLASMAVTPRAVWAWKAEAPPVDLTALSIEELMAIEVTTVSRKPEKLAGAAAAIFALTREDLRRSGATSIPEALRLVPGLQVARFDANKWALTSRGFNNLFANKLLVLIDGRSVYTPMFSGVFWESQDVLQEDIERIEIIRGPGATLWGANAVNGIINILTQKASDTQGGLLSWGMGSEERFFGNVRYGGRLGPGYYRVYGKYFARDDLVYRDDFTSAPGTRAADGWDMLRAGFRADWDLSDRTALMLQGDAFAGTTGQLLEIASLEPPHKRFLEMDARMSGGHLQGRWERTFSDDTHLALQLYYDHTARDDSLLVTGFYENYDIDFQHRLKGGRHEIVWGAGYRLTHDEIEDTFTARFARGKRNFHLFSAFVQDDFDLSPELLRLTLGSKFEHHTFTGWEIQPNARLRWTPHPRHAIWGAVARAVRTPARGDHDMQFIREIVPPGALYADSPPVLIVPQGSPDFESEVVRAIELGYRVQPAEPLFVDLATFYNFYDRLTTYEPGEPENKTSPIPHVILPIVQDNKLGGNTRGAEVAADWRVSDGWRMRAGYTYLKMNLEIDPDSQSEASENAADESPRHQFLLNSFLDLPGALELDLSARYVDELPGQDIDHYYNLDARLGWRPRHDLALSIAGQNLLDRRHSEFRGVAIPIVATEVERGLYGKMTWTF